MKEKSLAGNWAIGFFYEPDGTAWSPVELAVERRLARDVQWQAFLQRRRHINQRRQERVGTGAVKYRCPF